MVMAAAIFRWVLRLGLAGIYLFAAIPKILEPWDFARSIWNFRILPLQAIPPVALWLPVFEAVAALAILTGLLYRGGLVCITGLSLAFGAGVASAMARGLDIDCGCFGKAASSGANLQHLLFNAALVAAGIILLAYAWRRPRKRRPHG
jgi:hypothetical protein